MAQALVPHADITIEPWERIAGEPDKAWEAFVIYRDLRGRRSYQETTRQLGKTPGYAKQIEKWASKFSWVNRAFAYDIDIDRRDRARMEARKDQMELMQERVGRLGTELAIARLEGGTYTAADGTVFEVEALDPNRLDPYRLVALLSEATRTWRLAHGEATDFVKGIFMLSSTDVARIVESIMELAYDFWGEDERWAMFVDGVRAIPGR